MSTTIALPGGPTPNGSPVAMIVDRPFSHLTPHLTMKRLTVRARAYVGASAFCLVSVLRLSAQTTAPIAAQENNASDEAIVLSPFVVDATEDTDGYSAQSTLGGARVRTDLRDVASPFSVTTAQFLKDTSSNNNQ